MSFVQFEFMPLSDRVPRHLDGAMTLPASALPVEAPQAFLGVNRSATGKLWRDRLDARGQARALAIVQRYQLPEMLARVLADRLANTDRMMTELLG